MVSVTSTVKQRSSRLSLKVDLIRKFRLVKDDGNELGKSDGESEGLNEGMFDGTFDGSKLGKVERASVKKGECKV